MSARLVAASALLALATPSTIPVASRPVPSAPPQQASPPAAAAPATTPAPQNGARSPRIANYSIDARLDPSTRSISATQTLTWQNATANATDTLRFHLYYNAWRNSESTWMRERRLGGDKELERRPADDWGRIDLHNVRISRANGHPIDATNRLRFIAPDDGNGADRTVAEVPLDGPAQPGDTLSVRIEWSSRVPRTFARTGVIGSDYFIAQWFPKIGVLEDSGWNCHQFHAATEFFSDFGNYDVRLTVPSGWIVGATGVEKDRREAADGTTTHHYYQEDVHDFAWTTSPDYVERTATFSHATLPAVAMRLLLQPEHRGQADRHFEATRAALKLYGEWFGAYPYRHITIVDPAWQSDAGGMEYPTLFTAGTRWLAPRGSGDPEGVTIHEAGHQFWYGIVASNEFEDAWLDEGLNTFATSRVVADTYGPTFAGSRYFGDFIPWVFRDLPLRRDRETWALARYRAAGRFDVQELPTWRYWPGSHWGTTYYKTALWLHMLERRLGWDTLRRILSTFFERWAFRHPTPADFFAVVNEVSGQDLTWFFDQVYRSAGTFDYGVDVFSSEPIEVHGLRGSASAATATEGRRGYRTTVVVRRHGEGVFPVDVRVLLENNQEIRWKWDGRDRWKLFEVEDAVRARRAEIDPEHLLLLDVRRTNNSADREPRGEQAARKWSLVWLIWLQDHLLTNGFFI
ncbi:MAG: M1 family metallopeptidase [Vicinamibacterales bacterium]